VVARRVSLLLQVKNPAPVPALPTCPQTNPRHEPGRRNITLSALDRGSLEPIQAADGAAARTGQGRAATGSCSARQAKSAPPHDKGTDVAVIFRRPSDLWHQASPSRRRRGSLRFTLAGRRPGPVRPRVRWRARCERLRARPAGWQSGSKAGRLRRRGPVMRHGTGGLRPQPSRDPP